MNWEIEQKKVWEILYSTFNRLGSYRNQFLIFVQLELSCKTLDITRSFIFKSRPIYIYFSWFRWLLCYGHDAAVVMTCLKHHLSAVISPNMPCWQDCTDRDTTCLFRTYWCECADGTHEAANLPLSSASTVSSCTCVEMNYTNSVSQRSTLLFSVFM